MKITTHDVRRLSAKVRGGKPYCVASIIQWCKDENLDILDLHNGIHVDILLASKDGRAVQIGDMFIEEQI